MNTIIFNICVLGSNGFDFSGIAHVNVGFIGLQKTRVAKHLYNKMMQVCQINIFFFCSYKLFINV